LETLGALRLVCPVELLVLETCERGLSDQMATWKNVRHEWKQNRKQNKTTLSLAEFVRVENWMVSGTLQSFWGDSGIKLQQQLVDFEESLAGLNLSLKESLLTDDQPAGTSALTVLQGDIRKARHLQTPAPPLSPSDNSLCLINASSALRELEGARDTIRGALQCDRNLQPSDVLMILTDTNRYAPLLPAVFGSTVQNSPEAGPDGLPRIPWHLADRSLRADSDTMAALQDVLKALLARITLPVLADLLAQPAIQARLQILQSEVVEIVEYLETAGFRWGLNKQDRTDGQPGEIDGMWTLDFAVRRLAAGFAHPDSARNPVGGDAGVTPLPAFEGLASAKLMRFIAWASDLEQARGAFNGDHSHGTRTSTVDVWLGWLHEWMPKLIELGGEREGQSVWLAHVTRALADGARILDKEASFSSEAFINLFIESATAFEQSLPLGRGIGGMTVASPRMARVLPAKMIVVIGLSDGAWPQQEHARPRGLLKDPLPGDRSRREEDRLTTLEWLLSADQALVWTWHGRNEQSGGDLPPSVVVGELLDVLGKTFQASTDKFIQKLSMHAFDPVEFSGGKQSYDVIAVAAATELQKVRRAGTQAAGVEWHALPLPQGHWGLPYILDFARTGDQSKWKKAQWIQLATRLVKFWKLPCNEFLTHIGVQVEEEYEMLPEREALKLNGLQSWALRDELLRELIKSALGCTEAIRTRLTRAGKLPPGVTGEQTFKDALEKAFKILKAARNTAGADGSISLLQAMDWNAGTHLVRVCSSSAAEKHLLTARIEQMVHAVILLQTVHCTLCFDKKEHVLPPMGPKESLSELQRLTALALLGTTFPLPFFPGTSAEYAEKKTIEAAIEAYWLGNSYAGAPPESENPACRIAFRGLDPLSLDWPDAPQLPVEWNKLLSVATLPANGNPLFTKISDMVFGFIETIEIQKQERDRENQARKEEAVRLAKEEKDRQSDDKERRKLEQVAEKELLKAEKKQPKAASGKGGKS
ncbi:MAG: hypothetical protein WCL16_08325, partial [bacterium]